MPEERRSERAVAVIVRNERLLVIRRYRDGRCYYVLPGGGAEHGETPAEACVREVEEETGLTVAACNHIWNYNNQGRLEHYFLVSHMPGEPLLGGPERECASDTNQYQLEWVDLHRLQSLNLKPEAARSFCIELLRRETKL